MELATSNRKEKAHEAVGFTSFDELLAYNCAPVLAGIKPANLLSLMPDDGEEIDALLVQYNVISLSRE